MTKNPDQLPKEVRSEQPEPAGPALQAMAVDTDDQYAPVLHQLPAAPGQRLPKAGGGRRQVSILGRYNSGKSKVQPVLTHRWEHLKVEYSTVHSAKGKEADYVIIIDVTAGGFPSTIEDDPLLALAMPTPERYPHAEERRLFYVALTRTRRIGPAAHRDQP